MVTKNISKKEYLLQPYIGFKLNMKYYSKNSENEKVKKLPSNLRMIKAVWLQILHFYFKQLSKSL